VTTAAVDAAVVAAARAARAPAIASNAQRNTGQGSLRAALFPSARKLLIEGAILLVLIGVGAALAWKLSVHHPHNPRALGGANVDVAAIQGSQTEASFVTVPGHPTTLVGVDDSLGLHTSIDGGRTWHTRNYAALTTLCTHRDPRLALDASGREYIAYIGSDLCADELQPYLLVAARPSATAPWHIARVTKRTWEFGYDDAPAIAVDQHRGTVYVAFTRSLGPHREAVVVSRSTDHGRTWSDPLVVDPPDALPHLAHVAVAANGDVYVAGIDAVHGIWAARSTDGGRTFGVAAKLATLRANPSEDCARTGVVPVAQEERSCAGPNVNLVATGGRVYAVYADAAANGTQDVVLAAADASLKPVFDATVNPPDLGKTQQLLPVASVDATDGVLWSCWYDTSYWPSGKNAWFTCSHSRDARHWSVPVRAAAVPSPLSYLFVVYAYSGLVPALTAAGGVAHPFWLDSRRTNSLNDIFTAAIPLKR
jgi:hypothetical protein